MTRDEIKRLEADLVAAERAAAGPRDWPEDFADENGQYCNICVFCGNLFAGYKRRMVCRLCRDYR